MTGTSFWFSHDKKVLSLPSEGYCGCERFSDGFLQCQAHLV